MSAHRIGLACCLMAALGGCTSVRSQDPAPGNEMPNGYLDTPRDGETVGRMVDVSGWAADDTEGVRVRVYVDHRFVAATDITISRPDVTTAFPQYAGRNDIHGWRVQVDLGPEDAPHVITAQAIDAGGAVRDLRTVGVKVISR